MDVETATFLYVLYAPVPTSPVRMKALPLIADPYLTVKCGWNIEKILKFTGQIALFKGGGGGCIFQWFLTEYCSYGGWNFQDLFLHDRAIRTIN